MSDALGLAIPLIADGAFCPPMRDVAANLFGGPPRQVSLLGKRQACALDAVLSCFDPATGGSITMTYADRLEHLRPSLGPITSLLKR